MKSVLFIYNGSPDRFMRLIDNMPELYDCNCKMFGKSVHINVSKKDNSDINKKDIREIRKLTGFKVNKEP